MTKSPVIVVGRGLAGLTTAMCLARRKSPVKVFYDSEDQNAATPATHGICTIKGILESDTERFDLQQRGHRGFEPWLREWEVFLNRSRPKDSWLSGVREVFPSMDDFRSEFGRIYRKDFLGAKNVVVTTEKVPAFAEAYYPGDFWIDPGYLIKTYQEACVKLGVSFEDFRVGSLKADGDSLRVIGTDGKSKLTPAAVLCAGYGLAPILADLGRPSGEMFAVAGYTFKSRVEHPDSCFVKKKTGIAFKNGVVHFGSTSDKSTKIGGDSSSLRWRSTDEEEVLGKTTFQETACDISKGLIASELSTLEVRWGVRVRTRERMPLVKQIQETRNGGIWINTGYYKSGTILSWLIAEDLAAKIAAVVTGA